jgi:hypothetical protein
LRKQYPNSNGGVTENSNIYTVCASRTAYSCSKITDGIFRVQVYAISNKMDTSKPKDQYFLILKEA